MTLRTALAFFRSVIRSGEPWSNRCEETYSAALRILDAEERLRICPGCGAAFGLSEAHSCVTHSFSGGAP